MSRSVPFFLALMFLGAAQADEEPRISQGVITANNVDVTADDGSLLSDRLNVGDTVYVIHNPRREKKGWVRIGRTPEDAAGIGWVESKYVQTFSRYSPVKEPARPSASELSGEKTVYAPDVERTRYFRIGILPFQSSEPDDPLGRFAYEAFSMALRKNADFKVAEARSGKPVDLDSDRDLQKISASQNFDGLFVGKVSGDLGGSRLLQVKFYGKDREGFVIEKVTRLPKEGNLQEIIDRLAASTVQMLK